MWPSDFIGIIAKGEIRGRWKKKYVWIAVPGIALTRNHLLWRYKLDPSVKNGIKTMVGLQAYLNKKGLVVLRSRYQEANKESK